MRSILAARKLTIPAVLGIWALLCMPAQSLADLPNLEGWYASLRWADNQISREDREDLEDAQRTLQNQMPAPGLKIGERAPPFSLPNARGERVFLYEMLQKGPVVLVFYRGAWCP